MGSARIERSGRGRPILDPAATLPPMRFRRPFAAGSALGALAHHSFETRAGVGLVFEPELGRRGAIALWGALFPRCSLSAARRRAPERAALGGQRGDRRRRRRRPLRRLALVAARRRADARRSRGPDRGAAPRLQRRALVLARDAASSASPARPARGSRRLGLIAGAINFPILLASARHHFRWAREQAELEPERWSPALREVSGARSGPAAPAGPSASASTTSARRPKSSVGAIAADAPASAAPDRDHGRCPGSSRRLDARGLPATFFVEGLNAELYPDLLREIDAARPRGRLPRLAPRAVGRAVGRASRPRTWPGDRRPSASWASRSPACGRPGGSLGEGGARGPARGGAALLLAGRRRCRQRGRRLALLPFEWRHVDASLRAAAARRTCASR